MLALTVVVLPLELRWSKNLEVVFGTFQDRLIDVPFKAVFVADSEGASGGVVSIVTDVVAAVL